MPKTKSNSPQFAVGEPVVMQHPTYFTEWDGALGVVVDGLAWRWGINMTLAKRTRTYCYLVRILAADGMNVQAKPHQLRKLREPGEDDARKNRRDSRKPVPVIVR